jgi:hypothetical protein
MKFKAMSNKYKFDQKVLIMDFPDYLVRPIANWMTELLDNSNRIVLPDGFYPNNGRAYLKDDFKMLCKHIFVNSSQMTGKNVSLSFLTMLTGLSLLFQICLQNYAKGSDANRLEGILAIGGSGYEVIKTKPGASEYEAGVYDLNERVPAIAKAQATEALNTNSMLLEAWQACYQPKPNYEKTVTESCDFLENFLGKIYFPKDTKPQLKKFVHAFESKPDVLSYKGDSIVQPKSLLTSLLRKHLYVRGQHKAGSGRKPTKEEAELVLHVSILIWNMHQKAGK